MQQNKTALVWFTNNLRVNDNESLYLATQNYEHVIAMYCFNPERFATDQFGFKKTEKFRAKFLIETLTNLKESLAKLNISLQVYNETPEKIISELVKKHSISALFFQKEFTEEETITIKKIKQTLLKNTKVFEQYEQFLFHPDDIPFNAENIPQVFTNFRKKVEKYASIRNEYKPIKKPANNLVENSTITPSLKHLGFNEFEQPLHTAFPFTGGELSALARLNNYFFTTKKLGFYKKTRNGLVGTDYSSKFSAWLANGSISAKTIYRKVKEYEQQFGSNQSTYWLIFELIWRDFFKYIALKHGNAIFKIDGILQKSYTWQADNNIIKSWINGATDSDFVNANMIELKETGWMSNRGRQNVASYFSKQLKVDWRIGAAYFESMLIDYDVHSNYGNWLYVSGVGNDPRDRKFNVQLQAEHYDANHAFRKRWLQTTLF